MSSWVPYPEDPPGHWENYDQHYLQELTRFDVKNRGHSSFSSFQSHSDLEDSSYSSFSLHLAKIQEDQLELDNEFAFGRAKGARGPKPSVTK